MDTSNAEASVYETSDIESETEQTPVETKKTDEDIIEDEIEFEHSHGKFQQEFTNGKINFDYVANKNLYDSGYKVYRSETNKQRLSRLSRELYALKDDMEPGENDDKLKELIALAEVLNKDVNSHAKLNPYRQEITRLFEKVNEIDSIPTNEGSSDSENTYKATLQIDSEIMDLDKKVNRLELKLGDLESPIDNILNDLNRKVSIINNPEYNVEQIKTSINSLVEDPNYQRLINLSKHINEMNTTGGVISLSSEEGDILNAFKQEKINELVKYLPELQSYQRQNSLLLKRLRMLNNVHLNLESSTEFVTELDNLISNISTNVNNWNSQMSVINDKLDVNIENFDKNKLVIEKWVSELSEKVDTIKK